MKKVFIDPTYRNEDRADGGIRRVSEALWKYLPEFGFEGTLAVEDADVIHNHGARITERPGIPMISTCHGLYWSDYEWPNNEHVVNRAVTEGMLKADIVTTVSHWVKRAITRGTLLNPDVIYHGVDTETIIPAKRGEYPGYILWGKARADAVSSPAHIAKIAERLPHRRFVTTAGTPETRRLGNVKDVGVMPYERMIKHLQHADILLVDVRETFGIQTLEALACGTPIVGWDYGGQSEIVIPGVTGILVPYGDYAALENAIELIYTDWDTFSANARADAVNRWQWRDKIEQYAKLYQAAIDSRKMEPEISVIVTCHNLGRFLSPALSSVAGQKTARSWECIVVDDASSDNTAEVFSMAVGDDERFKLIHSPDNIGLSRARNLGFSYARGKYICNLDADDMYTEDYMETLALALDNKSGVHIVFGGLDTISEDGGNRQKNPFPNGTFNWIWQMAHLNQSPYAVMMRRRVWELSGGYRARDWRAEDAAWLSRVTSFGFYCEQATNKSLLLYRLRGDSKSVQERQQYKDADGNWLKFIPWRLANNARDGMLAVRNPSLAYSLVPWGVQCEPPPKKIFWAVPHHAAPSISVIIPCGPGHKDRVIDAVESVMGQTFVDWEVIVVNDTGDDMSYILGAPYAKIIRHRSGRGGLGPGAARNAGAKTAIGKWLLWLDADDILLPNTLSRFMEAAHRAADPDRVVIYGDSLLADGQKMTILESHEIICNGDWEASPIHEMRHSVTALVPAVAHREVGGFREDLESWEDWHYFNKLYAVYGACGIHVPIPSILYRKHTGTRREIPQRDEAVRDRLSRIMYNDFREYYTGVKTMACGRTPCNKAVQQVTINGAPGYRGERNDGMSTLLYLGDQPKHSILGKAGRRYRVGYDAPMIHAHPDDVNMLLGQTIFGKPKFKIYEPVNLAISDDGAEGVGIERVLLESPALSIPGSEGEALTVPVAPEVFKASDVQAVMGGSAISIIEHASNEKSAGFLSAMLGIEMKRDKPRKTVLAAIQAQLSVLVEYAE